MNRNEHVFVTGGTGFIGRPLCEALVSEGYRVTVLSRSPERAGALLPKEVAVVGALSEMETEAPVWAVINLAGEPLAAGRWTEERKQEFYNSRVETTAELYRHFAGREAPPPEVLISGSAIGYYGPQGDKVLDERGGFTDSFSHRLCADWEAEAQRFEALDTRVCLLRTGIVLGPDGGALSELLPIFRMGLGGRLGSGRQWMSWIHRQDMVGIILHCLKRKDLNGPVNGTAPNPVTNKEFAQTLGKVLGRPGFWWTPGCVMKLLYGQMAEELLLSGQKVYPRKAVAAKYRFRFPDLEEALRDILARSA